MSRESNLYLWSQLAKQVRENAPGLPLKRDEVGDIRIVREDGRSFANVVVFPGHVSVFLLPCGHIPDLVTPEMKVRKTGRVTFKFKDEDDPLIEKLGELVAICFAARELY